MLYLCMAKGRKKVDDKDKIVNHSIGTTKNQWEQLEYMAFPESVGKLIIKKLKPKNVPLTEEQREKIRPKKKDLTS